MPSLARSEELLKSSARNIAAYWEHLAGARGKRSVRWDEVWAVDAQTAHPLYNAATVIRPLEPAQIDDMVARLTEFYATLSGGPWTLWSPWPSFDLEHRGFEPFGRPPIMARRPGGTAPPVVPALDIVEVANAATMADFERAAITGYPAPDMLPVHTGALFDGRVLGGPLRLWVGYADDRPVTTAAALADKAVNGVYLVATVPGARGRGFGTAVTAQAVAAYPSLPAVLVATEMGEPVYQRLGFTEIGRLGGWVKPRPGDGQARM
jgi:GNAT superfamily N-acetyltransferase